MRKIKKLVATLLAATMVMAMGVTAFAAETLTNGTYTANQNLYKNSNCSTTSMGDAAVNDLKAEIVVNGDTATLKVHTHEITYLGLTGHLGAMSLKVNGTTYTGVLSKGEVEDGDYAGETDYIYTFTGVPTSAITEGAVLEGSYTAKVSIMPKKATGYLKLTNITAE